MKQSEFVLCPRGLGVGSIRFWEAIEYGATPIVISDNLLLPSGLDYLRVSENNLYEIINNLTSERLTTINRCISSEFKYSDVT